MHIKALGSPGSRCSNQLYTNWGRSNTRRLWQVEIIRVQAYIHSTGDPVGCQAEILPGPARTLRWGVPEGARSSDGEFIHHDYLLADALVAELDRLKWNVSTIAETFEGYDPLEAFPWLDQLKGINTRTGVQTVSSPRIPV